MMISTGALWARAPLSTSDLKYVPVILALLLLVSWMYLVSSVVSGGLLVVASYPVYMILLHPLSRFPGPKLAAMTKLYELYRVFYKNDWLANLEYLHAKHGPIVRIGPNELHMTDHKFCLEHHKRADLIKTDTYYGLLGTLLGGLSDPASHAERKVVLQPLFQGKTLAGFSSSSLNDHIKRLVEGCGRLAEGGGEVNMTHRLWAFTNDVMLSYLYGEDMGFQDGDLAEVHDETRAFNAIDLATTLRALPPFRMLLDIFPVLRQVSPLGWIDKLTKTRLANISSGKANLSTVLANIQARIGNPAITTQEASQAVFIGNESLLSNLTFLLHLMIQHPETMERLRAELDTLDGATYGREVWKDPGVTRLPYLDALCRESTRLSHPGWHRQPRQVRQEVEWNNTVIPAMTSLSFTPTLLERDPTLFTDPLTFRPERWLGPDAGQLRAQSVTFGTGTRTCLGQHVARVVLRKTIAALVYSFDITLWDEKRDQSSGFRYLNTYPKRGNEGYMMLRLRPRLSVMGG